MQTLVRVISRSFQTGGMDERIQELVDSSRKALRDCSIENGAIVAANSDKDYYPENVANYRFVWPRDAGYVLYAADILGLDKMEQHFFDWLLERAEGFDDSGIIYHRYSTNGPRDTDFGYQYQPDQAAAVLWATLQTNDNLTEEHKDIIHLLADGLWKQWDEISFHHNNHDLWEEREAHVDLDENFSYTLAACAESLYLAADRLGEEKWYRTAEMMRKRLEDHRAERDGTEYYPRTYGEFPDGSVDAANLGLVWPFNVVNDHERLENTVKMIEEHNMTDRGVMRYPGDMYDGMVHHTQHLKKGAGAWPILSFWYAIALDELGRTEEAHDVFQDQIHAFDGKWIPEQVFEDDARTSIKPLGWSHAMFVIAADRLDYI